MRAVDRSGNRHFDDGPLRRLAVFRVVVGPFEIVERAADVDRPAMLRADFVLAGKAGEIGQLADGQVDLHAGAGVIDPPHGFQKRRRAAQAGSSIFSNVRCASTFEATRRAVNRRPSSRTTPDGLCRRPRRFC